jgi:CHAD domain-containing protein
MSYRFKKNESLSHAIRRVFAEEIDWAAGQLAESKKRGEAVHEARKSLKKIRALLGLVARPLGQLYKGEDRSFRHAGKRLSTLRDNAVMLETFDALAVKHGEIDAPALAAIRHNLLRCQREAPPAKEVSADVVAMLAAARTRAASWPLESVEFAALLPDLGAAYRSGRKALKRALRVRSAESLHDFRKQVKRHWYHLRLFESNWNAETKMRVNDLRLLETCLGEWHNIEVLSRRIAADVETSRDRRQIHQFQSVLEEQAVNLQERALASGQRLYASKPRAFSLTLSSLLPSPRKRPGPAGPFAKAAVA